MRKMARTVLTVLALVACLALPFSAGAVTYEDSFSNCNYPKMFDLMVMRPVSFATMTMGMLLFVPLGAFAAFTVPDDFPAVYDGFIGRPARFTFKRPLGECNAVDLTL